MPTGWLDVHGHFAVPSTAAEREAAAKELTDDLRFITTADRLKWSVEESLTNTDKMGVTMQMLSNVPSTLDGLRQANDFGASIINNHPNRFGLFAALPTDIPHACLEEIDRTLKYSTPPDGFAVHPCHNKVYLSDRSLDPVWSKLNTLKAVLYIHPDAYVPQFRDRPGSLIEVTFETARTLTDMLYTGWFKRYPDIKVIFSHCAGAFPGLYGRILRLGTESWVSNPENITVEEMETQLGRLFIDTGGTALTGLPAAERMVGVKHCLYGSDCGAPCSTIDTMMRNKQDVVDFERNTGVQVGTIGGNAWELFPGAKKRAESG
ncbi:hypothetical protein BO94DRAFT_600991 [Aspergillus sclerotioniger CBS 115572]|uniref:6-methylsalicylate decarboxylase n=1 Tax=Aspergillus sclerotioniger CBS 115572 TaxID=1450535 RepID=A0A317XBN4_9EURO|nr:hypothetical protein BO94DRAFT_600991 [Aspergillus sclerotioniger CBS 115572]PWY95986.1 hypothetical protein BO94DRAFT_600991 [Aspergillus sclerotioniger CBS 115572]